MATYSRLNVLSMQAGGDLRTKQYHILRQSAAGVTNLASRTTANQTAVVDAIGVLQNKPNSGQAASVAITGESKVVAGAAITQGVNVTTNASGRAIVAASGDWTIGQAAEAAGADGEVIRVVLDCPPFRITY